MSLHCLSTRKDARLILVYKMLLIILLCFHNGKEYMKYRKNVHCCTCVIFVKFIKMYYKKLNPFYSGGLFHTY